MRWWFLCKEFFTMISTQVLTIPSTPYSPSLPQPSAGQSVECIGCQNPDPVVESGAQVMSMSHWPQQQLTVSPLELAMKFSNWQSWVPGAAQRWPGEGGRGGHSGWVEKISQNRIVLDKTALVWLHIDNVGDVKMTESTSTREVIVMLVMVSLNRDEFHDD